MSRNENDGSQPMLDDIGEDAEHLGNWRRPTPNPNERPVPVAGQPNPRRRHGYTAVEVYAGATRVIRWEVEENAQGSSPV